MSCADTAANLGVYQRGGGYQGGTGYPLIRVLALMACGTRTIIDATFGTDRVGETRYAHHLLTGMRAGMIVLADRNFAGFGCMPRGHTASELDRLGTCSEGPHGARLLLRPVRGRPHRTQPRADHGTGRLVRTSTRPARQRSKSTPSSRPDLEIVSQVRSQHSGHGTASANKHEQVPPTMAIGHRRVSTRDTRLVRRIA